MDQALPAILLAMLAACTQAPAPAAPPARSFDAGVARVQKGCSGLNLVNGAATTAYPAVVRVMQIKSGGTGICTGTFISPNAVITAAHCIGDAQTGGLFLTMSDRIDFSSSNPLPAGSVASTAVFTNGTIGEQANPNDLNMVAKDHAIVLFPPGHALAYVGIATTAPTLGAVVTSVGFGLTSYIDAARDPAYDASKHAGSNKMIAGSDGLNLYVGGDTAAQSAAAGGTEVVNAPGDSGGPLLFNDMLAGTLSSVGVSSSGFFGPAVYESIFVDATSADTLALIAQANAAGAQIPAPGTPPSQAAASAANTNPSLVPAALPTKTAAAVNIATKTHAAAVGTCPQ